MYKAVKSFLYQGQPFASGDPWEPTGHRNDAAIIRARMVIEVDVSLKVQRAATKTRRKAGA